MSADESNNNYKKITVGEKLWLNDSECFVVVVLGGMYMFHKLANIKWGFPYSYIPL